ncbi:hypothetical protein PIB30_055184 [Stylosanthes scabra]|uniref:Uncharacterized protein n=1 Tax=Stylosanthes scabra TaxID=79078 RepID=A0ABU6XJ78_9FABA|nr:hypothetical protein [Stylosanthes scabra]
MKSHDCTKKKLAASTPHGYHLEAGLGASALNLLPAMNCLGFICYQYSVREICSIYSSFEGNGSFDVLHVDASDRDITFYELPIGLEVLD